MPKIICASAYCKYNADDNTCTADEVLLNDLSIMTAHEGRQHLWRCKTFEESEESKKLNEMIAEFFNDERSKSREKSLQ